MTHGVSFDVGSRVEIRVDTKANTAPCWIGAEYIERIGKRSHAVRIDGPGSPMARRREVDSKRIRAIGKTS